MPTDGRVLFDTNVVIGILTNDPHCVELLSIVNQGFVSATIFGELMW